MATVTGINGSRYYVNNPIWVEVDTSTDPNPNNPFPIAIVSNGETLFNGRYYPFNGKVIFDLAEIIKGLIKSPLHPDTISSGQYINLSTITATIYLPNFTSTKTFFRGGEASNRTNIQVPNEAVLSESEKIPVWDGYPSAKYYLDVNGLPIYTAVLNQLETERRRVATCDPVFMRFLNTKGGYSFWLFEESEITKKTKKGTIIERRLNNVDLGLTVDYTLNVSTRVEERYISTLEALLESSEVYVYNIQNILKESNPQFQQNFLWTRVMNEGGNMKWNNYEQVNEFDFSFDLNLKNDPRLIW